MLEKPNIFPTMRKSVVQFFLILFLFILPISLYSNIDSLYQQFNVQKGEKKLLLGLQIAHAEWDNPHDQLDFSLKLLKLADKQVSNTLLHAKILRIVSDSYYYCDSIDLSAEYLQEVIRICLTLSPVDSLLLGSSCNDLGLLYQDLKSFADSEKLLLLALRYLDGTNNYEELADTKSNIATLYHRQGKYSDAIELFKEVHELDLITENKTNQSSSLNSLGRIYVDWGKFETGLDYYYKSIALLDTIKDVRMLSVRYNNIGMVYQIMGDHNKAIEWIGKARLIDEQYGQSTRLASRYYNLGNSYASLKQRDLAIEYFEKALAIFLQNGFNDALSKTYGSLAQVYMNENDYEKSKPFLIKSKECAEKAGTLPEKSSSYKQLYEYYKHQRQFEDALGYYELHNQAEDSIYKLKVSEQVEEMEAQYQNQQKQAEIMRLESDNQLKIKEVAFKSKQRNWAFAGVLLLLVGLLILYRLFSTVQQQKVTASKQNAELDRLNQSLNRLFAIVSHDLRNATAAYQSSAKIIEFHLGKGQPEKLLPLAPEIASNAKNLSAMLEGLLQWSLAQIKGIEVKKAKLNVKDEVEKLVALLKNEALLKENHFEVNIDENEIIECDPGSFELILRNVTGNALKYTSGGVVRFSKKLSGDFLILEIADTGIGMSNDVLSDLFELGSEKVRRGTNGEKGTGLGMPLVAENVRKNGGEIIVESNEGQGTSVFLKFPLCKNDPD